MRRATQHNVLLTPDHMKTALLAGATGLVGSALLPLLLASERYAKVLVVGRHPVGITHRKLTQIVTELSELDAVRLRLIADDVYCCLGTTMAQAGSKKAFYEVDFSYVVKLAAISTVNFASQFLVLSSLGADPNSRFYYSRVKGELEQALRGAPFRAIHIFRPSLLLGERAVPRLGERVGAFFLKLAGPLLRGSWRSYRPVAAATVAQAMLRAAAHGSSGLHVHESDSL